jgi:hypothetical protein
MHIRTYFSPTLTASLYLLVISQCGPTLAADEASKSIAAPQVYYPGYQNYQTPPQGGWENYLQKQEKQNQQKAATRPMQDTGESTVQPDSAASMPQTQTEPAVGTQQYSTAPAQLPAEQPRDMRAPPPGYTPRGYGRRYDDRGYGRRRGGDGPGFSAPWDNDRGGMPWSSGRGGRSTPWGSDRGGRDMPWSSGSGGRSMPWDSGRSGWMDRDRFADRWDDMLNAPSDMGELPGGYRAPTVSTPNPVDVGDELDDAARDVPGQMRNVYDDNRRRNRDDR